MAFDREFAIEADGGLWLVQSRPITTLAGPSAETSPGAGRPAANALVSGLGAVPGVVSGRVRVLSTPKDGMQLEDGEILVAPMTNPDWVPTIRRAAAVITDGGGMTCHAAIVSREMGVPCVVGTRRATTVLRTGEIVTVDGRRGQIFEGVRAAAPVVAAGPVSLPAAPLGVSSTATLVYVNLAMASRAEHAAALPVDGVGLLRAEFMITDALEGVHPRKLLAEGRREELVDRMTESVMQVPAPSPPVRSSTGPSTSEPTSFAGWREATSSRRLRTIR